MTPPMTEAEREREPGFYWVQIIPGDWEVVFLNRHGNWMAAGTAMPYHLEEIEVIGPRIEPPQETPTHER